MEDNPGPFRELDKLVAGLIAVTTDMTDTYGDDLPDIVETVIGTNPMALDSDFDTVPDIADIADRTDPLSPASNRDGLADLQEVDFNGTASTGMGQIANYTWTFTYDGRMVTLHGPAPAFTFERAGTYRVTLNVTDTYGGTAEDSFSVKVEKEPVRTVPAWAYILVLDTFLLILLGILVVRRGREDGPEEERGKR
jgi:PKD repeat protein